MVLTYKCIQTASLGWLQKIFHRDSQFDDLYLLGIFF